MRAASAGGAEMKPAGSIAWAIMLAWASKVPRRPLRHTDAHRHNAWAGGKRTISSVSSSALSRPRFWPTRALSSSRMGRCGPGPHSGSNSATYAAYFGSSSNCARNRSQPRSASRCPSNGRTQRHDERKGTLAHEQAPSGHAPPALQHGSGGMAAARRVPAGRHQLPPAPRDASAPGPRGARGPCRGAAPSG
jgi:hypothetical protein